MNLKTIRKLRKAGDHEVACELVLSALANEPEDAELHLEAASLYDYLGREAEAVPHYCSCISAGLPPHHLRQAYLGLGSRYRVLGQYQESERVFREALQHFPHANEIKVFLAMTLHNLGRAKESIELLLRVVAKTSRDKTIRSYKGAILFYSEDIEKIWPNANEIDK